MVMLRGGLLLFLILCMITIPYVSSQTHPEDVFALKSVRDQLRNVPPRWSKSDDPCGARWEGVTCDNSRVINLTLYNMGIEGTLSPNIGNLTQLQLLDLSSNKKLGGPLPATLGYLSQLTALKLIDCSFTDRIPDELGNLTNLTFLALNSNKFTGNIPATLGKLSVLTWLDLADNQLSGSLPVSTNQDIGLGLDQLLKAQHFHLNKNNLSGEIPESLFSANMNLIHILLDRNQLTGSIPKSVGLVASLEVLQLSDNGLNSTVPSTISNLKNLYVLNLAHNNLIGQMPNLTSMTQLQYLDLSYNNFTPSEAPAWISNLQNLTTLFIESGGLHGQVPQELFGFPYIQNVSLKHNSFNGTFDMGNNISANLTTVDLQYNVITSVTLYSTNYNYSLLLAGNPVCGNSDLSETDSCQTPGEGPSVGSSDANNCDYPFEGYLVFRAPFFSNPEPFMETLTSSLYQYEMRENCAVKKFSLNKYYFDDDSYLRVALNFCPSKEKYFNLTEILLCFDFNRQDYTAPQVFGPYSSYGNPYHSSNKGKGYIIGIVVACAILAILLVLVAVYAVQQKKRVQRERLRNDPFASWQSRGESGDAPRLNEVRGFTYDEITMYTNNFLEINEIGSGGYGKVYKGKIPDGRIIAIKRSKQGSMQGGLEFKTEIELLSRVHHKNLVSLVGFCFEKGERMLVYEFISNGNLREALSGLSGIQLDWKRRLRITLDSARGLVYLHDHANPPIIHSDVKSTNVLLDEDLTAKVADFGLSQLVVDPEIGHVTADVKGTLGYLDPEYYMTQQLTGKSDVYSFGVVMLELITARPPIQDKDYIVRLVKNSLNMLDKPYLGLTDLIDPILIHSNETLVGFEGYLDLALRCLEDSSKDRPTMNEIVKEIETILQRNGLMSMINSNSSSMWNADGMRNSWRLSFEVESTSSISRQNISSSNFKYSGGFPSQVKLPS